MKATSGDQSLKVAQVNGVMTGIKAPKNITKIQLSYTPPYYYLLITLLYLALYVVLFSRDGQDKNNVATHIFNKSTKSFSMALSRFFLYKHFEQTRYE